MIENATTIILSNASAALPLEITTTAQVAWHQYIVSLVLGGAITLWMLTKIFSEQLKSPLTTINLKIMSWKTKRPSLLIRHNEEGFLSGQMIRRSDIGMIKKHLNSFKGRPFNLILHTPGGEVFTALFISKLLRFYPGRIHVYVPQYAMSGGTILALSGHEIYMNEHASLGMVDPQLGNLFRFGSARAWEEVIKHKGKKASDEAYVFRRMGLQVEKTIRGELEGMLSWHTHKWKKLAGLLVNGQFEHIFQVDKFFLHQYDVPIKGIDKKLVKVLDRLCQYKSERTIFGVKNGN